MKRGVKIVLVLVLIIFLVSGCYRFPWHKKEKPSLGRGLKIYFGDQAPPTDRILVGEGATFLVSVNIDNYGEGVSGELNVYDNIPGDDLESQFSDTMINIDEADFIYNRENKLIDIRPSKTVVGPYLVKYDPKDIAPGTRLNIFADLLIESYNVELESSMCLKREDALNVPCSNKEVITDFSKEAKYVPVTIDRIEKTATPMGEDDFFVNLKVILRNVGGGDIASRGQTIDDPERIIEGGRGNVRCSPSKLVFYNNEASMNCIVKGLKAGQAYQTYHLIVRYSFPYRMRIKVGPIPLNIIEREDTRDVSIGDGGDDSSIV